MFILQLPIKNISSVPTSGKSWEKFRDFASIVCSRESTYRTALDITGFDIPVLTADAFRGIKKFLESSLECLSATVVVAISPFLTTFVGKLFSKQILPRKFQKDTMNLLKFNMDELRDLEKFKKGIERISGKKESNGKECIGEEVEDKLFVASLFEKTGRKNKAEFYENEAKEIKEFSSRFEPSEELRKAAYKLKKATIIGESFLEGGWWGGYGLLLRLFRKHVLKEDRFTGTKGYVSDSESAQLGEAGDLNLFQKAVGVCSIFISPILSTVLLNKLENREAVAKSKFLQVLDSEMDMTHGVYPKLGLLFTQTTIPKWIGTITLSQGWFERVERIMKLFTVIPSWWLGHRVTNGTLALKTDEKLAKKYGVSRGILVDKEYLENKKEGSNFFVRLRNRFPEPAKINHVMKVTDQNKELQKEAEDEHAKSLYKGFALHSFSVWAINMIVNQITKLRALSALGR